MPVPPAVPVLLLHGFLGRGADWDAVRAYLPDDWPVLAPDLPGHGSAVQLEEDAYTMDGAVDRLLAHLDRPVDVVGYSMGGRLALHFALRHPDRIRRLVLVSASPGLRTEAERADRRALDADRAAALAADLPGFLDRWYRMPLFDLPEPLRRGLTADRVTHNDAVELGRSLASMGTGAQPSHWNALGALRTPTWALAGARDAKFVQLVREMAEAGPVEPVVLPDAGHLVPVEAPTALADVLRRVLRPGS